MLIAYCRCELLAHIFYLGSLDDPIFVVTAGRVCGLWRDITLRTPTLWRTIHLDCRVDMWQARIMRAGICSLDVHLQSPPGHRHTGQRWNHFSVQWVMQPALPHIYRWRSLDIRFDTYAPFLWNAALSPLCRESQYVYAEVLQELSLVYPLNDDNKLFDLFNGVAPHLRRVILEGIRVVWTPSVFENLTYLDYTHHGFTRGTEAMAEMLAMLQISSRLEYLSVNIPPPKQGYRRTIGAPPHRAQTVVTLPRLHTFRAVVTEARIPTELMQLFAYLNASRLGTLVLEDTTKSQWPLQGVENLARALSGGLSSVSRLCLGYGFVERRFILSVVGTWSRMRCMDVTTAAHGRFGVVLPPDMGHRDRTYLRRFGRTWLDSR